MTQGREQLERGKADASRAALTAAVQQWLTEADLDSYGRLAKQPWSENEWTFDFGADVYCDIRLKTDTDLGRSFNVHFGGIALKLSGGEGGATRWTKPTADKVITAVRQRLWDTALRHVREQESEQRKRAVRATLNAIDQKYPKLARYLRQDGYSIRFKLEEGANGENQAEAFRMARDWNAALTLLNEAPVE